MSGSQSVGVISGYLTRPVLGMFVESELTLAPELRVGELSLRVPLSFRGRNVMFDHLPEVRGDAHGELRFRPSARFRVMAAGGVRGVHRPGWADRYQPIPGGGLLPTDRYSHWRADAQLEVAGIPITHHHARLEYRFELVQYRPDPNFDPIGRPTHLVPRNAIQHGGRLTWHFLEGDLRVGGEVEASHRQYLFAFARDRGTGLTHAGPGGEPPNPLEALVFVRPALEGRMDFDADRIRVEARYRHDVIVDVFQGYRSQHGPSVRLGIRWMPLPSLTVESATTFIHHTYFDGGYQTSRNHPLQLDDGAQRYDWRLGETATVGITLSPGLVLELEYSFLMRRTNFPDYQPGVFPARRAYTLDWDFDNHRLMARLGYAASF